MKSGVQFSATGGMRAIPDNYMRNSFASGLEYKMIRIIFHHFSLGPARRADEEGDEVPLALA